MNIHPALQRMLNEANAETAAMIADTIASGQVDLLASSGFPTRDEAVAALKPFSTFVVVQNIAGRWVHC
ncbi:hypothetical protein [Pseudomonas sp. GOM6]|uniref:hypothetical protein n=1 Tax=Pseudomonas sp. GOM6 TaxID=3036944 RepID=UPI002409B075|nr:hypothetical protein [Pseudomonas sp. GOM6]MDG1580969.1 hypothetical protein [Pseudomonas sp. GOM6]